MSYPFHSDAHLRKESVKTYEGNRRVISSKKSSKKMDGQQGWSNSKKVRWVCKANKGVTPLVPSDSVSSIYP